MTSTGDRHTPSIPFDRDSSRLWVGMLVTEKDRTPVVYDPTLPGVPTGQVYLFNVNRGTLVPYRRDIVSRYLQDVSPEERRQVRSSVSAAWKTARRDFVKQRSRRRQSVQHSPQPDEDDED